MFQRREELERGFENTDGVQLVNGGEKKLGGVKRLRVEEELGS